MAVQRSGLNAAGTALLLAGAIVSAALAILVLVDPGRLAPGPVTWAASAVLAAGAVLAAVAWRLARAGGSQRAFVVGLVAALLPPVQVLALAGAILVRLAPEAEAQRWTVPGA